MQISLSSTATVNTRLLPTQSPPSVPAAKSENIIFDFFRPNTLPSDPNRPAILNFTALPKQEAFETAVAQAQNRVDRDLSLQNTQTERKLYLRQNYQSILKTQPEPSAKGTVIMLHGYTAGPWQYQEAADQFFDKGFNVIVPRIPGHGFMEPDGTPSGEKMVHTWDEQQYETFVDEIYQEAKALGGAVHVIGLSGGSGLALRMAEKYDAISSVSAMTPYLGPDQRVRPAIAVLEALEKHSFIPVGKLMDLKPYGTNLRIDINHPMPHTQGSINNAYASLTVGARVEKVSVPVQYFTTSGDLLSGTPAVQGLIERSGGLNSNGWFHFPAEDQVPHAMASPKQNTAVGQSERLWDMVFDMVEKGQTHTQLPEN